MRQNWQLWKGVLSDDECDNIIEICQNECIMQDGTVFSSNDYQPDKSIRDSKIGWTNNCLLYTSPSPRDLSTSRMPSSA